MATLCIHSVLKVQKCTQEQYLYTVSDNHLLSVLSHTLLLAAEDQVPAVLCPIITKEVHVYTLYIHYVKTYITCSSWDSLSWLATTYQKQTFM